MKQFKKSHIDILKLASLAVAISVGFVMESQMVRADDQKVACIRFLMESGESGTLSA